MLVHKYLVWALAGGIWLALAGAGLAQTATPLTLKLGKELFNENCAVCHQADAIIRMRVGADVKK